MKELKDILFDLLKDNIKVQISEVFYGNGWKTRPQYILRLEPQEKEDDDRNDIRVFPEALEYEITKEQYELMEKELRTR